MKTRATILAVWITGMACAQQAELANGFDGFESWVSAETGELPNYWDGFNRNILFNGTAVGTIECVEKSTTDPFEGAYSVKLTSTSIMGGPAVPGILTVGEFVVDWGAQDGDIIGGESYLQKPTELFGQFKFDPQGVDTGFVSVWFLENGVEVGRGRYEFTGSIGGWTAFSVAIDYDAGASPDSMNIMFSTSNSSTGIIPAGTVLEIDAIGFGAYANLDTQENSIRCYPNPTMEKVMIELRTATQGHLQLTDMNGAIIYSEEFNGDHMTIDTTAFPKGMYQLMVADENRLISKTIIVE